MTTNSAKRKKDWGRVKRVSIDEISRRKGHQTFATVVCDIDHSILLEVIDSHDQDEIIEVLQQQPIEVREQIEEVSVDMWGGFPKVVQVVFPNAKVVFDRFHVMQSVNKELNKIRQPTKITITGSKFILLKNGDDLTDGEQLKLDAILSHSQRLRKAYEFNEEFREIFETHQTPEEGKLEILRWLQTARSVYCDVIQTVRSHLDGICHYFLSRTTSGVMEGINNKLKLIKRQAYGFTNFENFRARLLACFCY